VVVLTAARAGLHRRTLARPPVRSTTATAGSSSATAWIGSRRRVAHVPANVRQATLNLGRPRCPRGLRWSIALVSSLPSRIATFTVDGTPPRHEERLFPFQQRSGRNPLPSAWGGRDRVDNKPLPGSRSTPCARALRGVPDGASPAFLLVRNGGVTFQDRRSARSFPPSPTTQCYTDAGEDLLPAGFFLAVWPGGIR